MTAAEAFHRAIVETPEDDTPRLVFADWLEEQGDPASMARAEFIRVQFALRDLPADDPRRLQMEERERDLRAAHEQTWTAPLREQVHLYGWEFRRGFVEAVAVLPDDFPRDAGRPFDLAPVRQVRFLPGARDGLHWRQSVSGLSPVASSPYLERVASLDLTNLPVGADLRPVIRSPHLGRLTELHVGRSLLRARELELLLATTFLSQLTTLRFDGYRVQGVPGLANLLRSPRLARLVTLTFSNCRLERTEVRALAESPHLGDLTAVHFLPNTLGPVGVRDLASSPGLPQLTALTLSGNGLGGEGAGALASSPLLSRLKNLDQSGPYQN
jgi:uncharacterized protein (TIGR02996 family)